MDVPVLGEPRFASPVRRTIDEGLRVPEHIVFVHVPTELLVGRRKSLDPSGSVWSAVLAATG